MTIRDIPTPVLKDMIDSDAALYRDCRTESVKRDLERRVRALQVELGRRLFEGSTV